MEKLLKLITAPRPPSDQVGVLSTMMGTYPELKAVLRLSVSYNIPNHKIRSSKSKITLAKSSALMLEDIPMIIEILNGEEGTIITTPSTFELACCMVSPQAMGLTKALVFKLLRPYSITFDEAITKFGIKAEAVVKETTLCACCNRNMVSVGITGLCSGCENYLPTFMLSRCGRFELPITVNNIPKLNGKSNTLPVDFTYTNYKVTKEGRKLIFTHTQYNGYKYYPTLPFVEFQKEIH